MGDRDTLACQPACVRLRGIHCEIKRRGGWEENRWIIKVEDGQVEAEEGGMGVGG